MSSRMVMAALVVLALAVGLIAGMAIARDDSATQTTASAGGELEEALAHVAQRDGWLESLAAASVAGRLEGASVAVLVADGASDADVNQVVSALEDSGASVGLRASLSADWWTPELAAFRGEIADQLTESVVGVEGLTSAEVLQHSIVQALVPHAVPAGAGAGAGTPIDDAGDAQPDGVSADRAEVLLEVLTRSGLVTVTTAATSPVDGLVLVTADGPEGAGTVADLAASVWERYVPATVLVVFDETSSPSVGAEAISHGETLPIADRPSLVIATQEVLTAPQVVMALVEQREGGTGWYGDAENLPLIASP